MGNTVDKVIKIANEEIGYLEKKTNYDLDSKTGNAGYNNYTKYWRDVCPSLQGSYWCACFISWLFMKAFGENNAKALLLHYPYVTCQVAYEKFKAIGRCYNTPRTGDIVVFWNGSRMYHTGLVVDVNDTSYTTIEGNTSGGSSIVSNGGSVSKKVYSISIAMSTGHKFLRPNYDPVEEIKYISSSSALSTVKKYQKYINKKYKNVLIRYKGKILEVDGIFGTNTYEATLLIWKKLVNDKFYNKKLNLKNSTFSKKCNDVSSKIILSKNTINPFVVLIKGMLAKKKLFSANTINAKFGNNTEKAVKKYQQLMGLEVDGVVGEQTWKSFFKQG